MAHSSSIRKSVKANEVAQAHRVTPRPGSGIIGMRHATELAPELNIPVVRLGEPVLWFAEGNTNATPHNAFVARIDTNTLALDVITNRGLERKPTVAYYTDPRMQLPGMRKFGGWKQTDHANHIQDLEDKIKDVNEKLVAQAELIDKLVENVTDLEAKLNK